MHPDGTELMKLKGEIEADADFDPDDRTVLPVGAPSVPFKYLRSYELRIGSTEENVEPVYRFEIQLGEQPSNGQNPAMQPGNRGKVAICPFGAEAGPTPAAPPPSLRDDLRPSSNANRSLQAD